MIENILITGSGGFIGKNLKEFLKDKYCLFTPRSSELDLCDSLAIKQYFSEHKIDFIIHSAATGVRIKNDDKLEDVVKSNLQMFNNLAEFVSDTCPMIVFGSGAEYDKSRAIINIKETDFDKNIPLDPYGYAKYLISKEIEKNKNILNLRIFGIYGYGENPTRVTSCIINDNINHRTICLNQNVRFSFIFIEDFCRIIAFFIQKFPSEKFINVTTTNSIEIKELAQIVNSISDYKAPIVFQKSGFNMEYTADNSLLLKKLGNFSFTSFENGMKIFYNQYKINL